MTTSASPDIAPTPGSRLRAASRAGASILATTLLMLGLCAGYGAYRFGSIPAAMAYLGGERLMVVDRSAELSGAPGDRVEASYTLTNWTGGPVKVIGVETSCSCTSVEGMPTTLAASETRPVKARIKIEDGLRDVAGSIRLYTDSPAVPEIKLSYLVRVAPAGRQGP